MGLTTAPNWRRALGPATTQPVGAVEPEDVAAIADACCWKFPPGGAKRPCRPAPPEFAALVDESAIPVARLGWVGCAGRAVDNGLPGIGSPRRRLKPKASSLSPSALRARLSSRRNPQLNGLPLIPPAASVPSGLLVGLGRRLAARCSCSPRCCCALARKMETAAARLWARSTVSGPADAGTTFLAAGAHKARWVGVLHSST